MRIAACITALILMVLMPLSARATGFFQSVNDLPLMDGLSDVPEATLHYDKPEGRIVELMARGEAGSDISAQAVRDFYARTLPQLGWLKLPETYSRDGEVLRIRIVRENGQLVVYLSIKPQ